jgi:penicillin-insensitive murein endopeptidase
VTPPPARPPAEEALIQPLDDEQDHDHADASSDLGGEVDDDEPEASPDRSATTTVELPPMSDDELRAKLSAGLTTLGSMSIGRTNAGALINGVQMPEGEAWVSVSPGQAWGTEETIAALQHCIEKIAKEFPKTPPLYIGHISARRGGYLSPHKSHQAGRDVDISYYLTTSSRWYARAHRENLDLARTWAFVRTLITDTDVDMIFIDRSIQRLLKDYAIELGEDRAWVQGLFEGGAAPIIRHARGHATHLHVRFHSPIARELARRAYPHLLKQGLVKVAPRYETHTVKKGNTIGAIARAHKTTVAAIMRANRLRSTRIRAGQALQIPKANAAGVAAPEGPVRIPPRRLPPSR